MDPLSILSIATAVVAFVDFGSKILVAARGIYTGASKKPIDEELQRLIQGALELEERAAMIKRVYTELESPRGREIDNRILQLGVAAEEAAQGINGFVLELQSSATKSKTKGFLTSKFSSPDDMEVGAKIARLDNAVSQVRIDMGRAFIDCMWLGSMENRQDFKEVKILLRKIDKGQKQSTAAPSTSAQARHQVTAISAKEQLVRQIWLDGPANFALDITSRLRVQGHLLGRRPGSDVELQNKILHSLDFREMRTRELSIPEPLKGTFEWIFKHRDDVDIGVPHGATWRDLRTWLLEDSDSVYWITGKPASGKSTLMRYIQGHESLESALGQWSGNKQLLFASFFAWNSGSGIQRTEQGILRTILLQFLKRTPEFISRVFPQRWALFSVFGTSPESDWDPAWAREELREACCNFLDLVSGSTFKLALFIDGLDEIEDEGAPDSTFQLVDSFRSRAGAKVCVSSRPETVFKDHFGDKRGMTLEEITANDIDFYVKSVFNNIQAFKELKAGDQVGSLNLVQAVVTGARGVFLWVKLVTEDLVLRMTKGDSAVELMDALDSLPQPQKGMSALYQTIWGRLEHQDKIAASRWFQIYETVRCFNQNDRGCTGIPGDGSPLLGAARIFVAEAADMAEAAKQPKTFMMLQMDRRLRSRTKGLLELVHQNGQYDVTYLHRSVKDWIDANQDELYSVTPLDFDPALCLVKACVATFFCRSPVGRSLSDSWGALNCAEFIMDVARHAKCFFVETHPATELVNCLDMLDTQLRKTQAKHSRADPDDRIETGGSSLGCLRGQWRMRSLEERAAQNTFLGMAAQYCALPYVKAKLGDFVREKGQVSLLENALVVQPLIYPWDGREERREKLLHARLELISLLLAHGSDPEEKCIMLSMCHWARNQWRLEKCKGRPLRKCVPLLAQEFPHSEFWDAVSRAFREHRKRALLGRLEARARAIFSTG
ncbi:hypothetical protein RB595_006052 [Gaeumannomyces hyphopodioides]